MQNLIFLPREIKKHIGFAFPSFFDNLTPISHAMVLVAGNLVLLATPIFNYLGRDFAFFKWYYFF